MRAGPYNKTLIIDLPGGVVTKSDQTFQAITRVEYTPATKSREASGPRFVTVAWALPGSLQTSSFKLGLHDEIILAGWLLDSIDKKLKQIERSKQARSEAPGDVPGIVDTLCGGIVRTDEAEPASEVVGGSLFDMAAEELHE
jgi:hypothetical protein